MLKVIFGEISDDVIFNVDSYFDVAYEPEWFEDPLVKEMVLDVDKSEVLSPYCIQSPVLGQISPTRLSGGVKALILMLKMPELIVYGTSCGDNCAKWIAQIAELQDITVCFCHLMLFDDSAPVLDAETGEIGSYRCLYMLA